jgi:hypothetical protein
LTISRTWKRIGVVITSLGTILGAINSTNWPAVFRFVAALNGWHVLFILCFSGLAAIGIISYFESLNSRFATLATEMRRIQTECHNEITVEMQARVAGHAQLVEMVNTRGRAEATESPKPTTLKQRTADLGNELFALVRKQGPQPADPLRERTDAGQRQAMTDLFAWKHNTFYHYMAFFRDRAVQLDYELAANGIMVKLDRSELDPPASSKEVDVQKVAEAFVLVANQIPSE